MTAMPPTFEQMLNYGGFLIKRYKSTPVTITVSTGPGTIGTMHVPSMALARLDYVDSGTQEFGDDYYLSDIPLFSELYRPAFTSKILDRFRDRRINADTGDVWRMWLIEWANENMPYFNQRYVSATVAMPLDTQSATKSVARDEEVNGSTSKDNTTNERSRHVNSDFPQGMLSGSTDYATDAIDANAETIGVEGTTSDEARMMNELETVAGRQGISVAELLMKQREAYVNVDKEVLDSMSQHLFLALFDQDEFDYNEYPDWYAVR